MRKCDLSLVAHVHMISFPEFFLTSLGPSFLALLYKSVLIDSLGIMLVAEFPEGIKGFVAGIADSELFFRRLIRKRLLSFAFVALSAAIKRPSIIPRLFRALQQPRKARTYHSRANLISIAVDPMMAGKGIGHRLIEEFEAALIQRDIWDYCLTTDRDNNTYANQFYQRMGFKVVDIHRTPEGRWMNVYFKKMK